jgi:hypothetical protein
VIDSNRIRETDSRSLLRACPAATRDGTAGQPSDAYFAGLPLTYGIVPLLVHASLAPHILGSRVAISRKRGVINTFGLLEDLAGALEPGPARDRYRTVVRLLDWYAKHHREAPGNLGELERDVSLIRRFARPLPVLADERERDYFGLARELALFRDLSFASDIEASCAHKIRAGFARFLRGIADYPDVAGSHATGPGSAQNLDPCLVSSPLQVLAYAIERMPAGSEPEGGETAKRLTPFRRMSAITWPELRPGGTDRPGGPIRLAVS